MTHVVSCVMPPAVENYLTQTYKTSAYSCLLEAAKRYTKTQTSASASNAAAALARERGCTKTDVYREALVAFDSDIALFWPAKVRSKGELNKTLALMAEDNRVPTAGTERINRAVRRLNTLKKDLPTLSSWKIAARLDVVIRILESASDEVNDK